MEIGSYFIDGAYLEFDGSNGTTAPDAWMSARNIDNRGDVGDGAGAPTQAQENQLNYIDVWGIPGDAPALIQTKLDWTTTAAGLDTIFMGKSVDGTILAANQKTWIDDNAFSTSAAGGGGNWTQPADAGRTEGRYRRFTDGAAPPSIGVLSITYTDDDARELLLNAKRMYVICRSEDHTTNTFRIVVTAGMLSGNVMYTGLTPQASNVWELVDVGLLNVGDAIAKDEPTPANTSVTFDIGFTMNGSGDWYDFDAILFMPVDEQIILETIYDFNPNTENTYIRGQYQDAIHDSFNVVLRRLGTLWRAEAGSIMSRYVFTCAVNTYYHGPTYGAAVELTITPRTRHLLGT